MGANFTRIDHEAFLLVCKSWDNDTIDFILPKFSEDDLSIPWYFKIACGYGNVKVVKYLVNYLPRSDFIDTDLLYKALTKMKLRAFNSFELEPISDN
ncbi:hypothetical protein AYI70_g3684 [Smittium culicis]|uniref:Ankyrin repeat protein n=1 Tax=Smittium culicis TaxID=133412 RepID=A0A1R1Y292_9FUNG|nr:hypothetical protein AYI70_g3684 [Smittium culicis]